MNILDKNIQTKFTIKKSKFLCFAFIVKSREEAKDVINKIKKEYPDASHICYAYILANNEYYHTDGGEPSGTAGLPIYNAIKSFDLNYCLFMVVRYFGGVKFGVGPLRTTFKDITLKTLNQAKISSFILSDIILIKIGYDKLSSVTKELRPYIKTKVYGKEDVSLELIGNQKEILNKLSKLKIDKFKIEKNRIVK